MEVPLSILYALADPADADSLIKTVSTRFSSVTQNLTSTANLLDTLRENSYHLLFLDCAVLSVPSLHTIAHTINNEFPDLAIVMLIERSAPPPIHPFDSKSSVFFIDTPIDPAEMTFCVNHCRTLSVQRQQHTKGTRRTRRTSNSRFIGTSQVMKELFEIIARVADDDLATVLIRGESGTGKELVAKAIHESSHRRKHNFVPVNCAAIPDELLESELFGHLKGSFTGAAQNKIGRIQYADNGTLFLDEIGDMKPTLQAKLLRVIQEREFEPVGSLKPTPVNTRIVAATHCDLEKLVSEGTFREDLYYRLSVIPLEVPSLHRRSDDIPLLLEEFIDRYTTRRGREKIVFSPETIALLKSHRWRGNVRELENLVQHMSILYGGQRIYPHHLPSRFYEQSASEALTTAPDTAGTPVHPGSEYDISRERAALFESPEPPSPGINFDSGPINFNELINEFEVELIVKAMQFTAGNKKEASRMLCLKRTTLLEKIKKKNIIDRW